MATLLLRRTPGSIVFFNNVGFHGHGYIIAPESPRKPKSGPGLIGLSRVSLCDIP